MTATTRQRDDFLLVAVTARNCIDRVLAAQPRPSRTRLAVLVVIVRDLVTYSRLEDALSLTAIATRAGVSIDSVRRALRAFEVLGVLRYEPGDTPRGGEARSSRIALIPVADTRKGAGGMDLQGDGLQNDGVPPRKATGVPVADRRHPSEKKTEEKSDARARETARALGRNRARVAGFSTDEARREFEATLTTEAERVAALEEFTTERARLDVEALRSAEAAVGDAFPGTTEIAAHEAKAG